MSEGEEDRGRGESWGGRQERYCIVAESREKEGGGFKGVKWGQRRFTCDTETCSVGCLNLCSVCGISVRVGPTRSMLLTRRSTRRVGGPCVLRLVILSLCSSAYFHLLLPLWAGELKPDSDTAERLDVTRLEVTPGWSGVSKIHPCTVVSSAALKAWWCRRSYYYNLV